MDTQRKGQCKGAAIEHTGQCGGGCAVTVGQGQRREEPLELAVGETVIVLTLSLHPYRITY